MLLETIEKTQTITQTTVKDNDVLVVILLYKNPAFKGTPRPFDLEICGKKMWKYTELACSDYEIKTTFCTNETDVIAILKPMLNDKKYTLVLYSDTPLLRKSTVDDITSYAKARQINAMKLKRGYIFNTEYLRQIDMVQNTITQDFGTNDFTQIDGPKAFTEVCALMKKRILDFHTQNGVLLHDTQTVFIGVDCIIEAGVEIFENNSIGGKTFIGRGTRLYSGNRIENSIIKENCILENCLLQNTKLERDTNLVQNKQIQNLKGET